jgi:hypothetical protein
VRRTCPGVASVAAPAISESGGWRLVRPRCADAVDLAQVRAFLREAATEAVTHKAFHEALSPQLDGDPNPDRGES